MEPNGLHIKKMIEVSGGNGVKYDTTRSLEARNDTSYFSCRKFLH